MAAEVFNSRAQAMSLGPDPALQQPEEEQFLSTFFCRALFDYQTDNDSSLSFRRDDIIEVLTRLESGWWDGLLGQERGWFPSNYVTVISDQEADTALAAVEAAAAAQLDFQNAQAAIGHTQNVASQEWDQPHGALHPLSHSLSLPENTQPHTGNVSTGAGLGVQGDGPYPRPGTQSSDFWVPQVSADGRVSATFPCSNSIFSAFSPLGTFPCLYDTSQYPILDYALLWALTICFLGVICLDLLREHPNGPAVSRPPTRYGSRHS